MAKERKEQMDRVSDHEFSTFALQELDEKGEQDLREFNKKLNFNSKLRESEIKHKVDKVKTHVDHVDAVMT